MKSLLNQNESRLSDLESEEGVFDLNDNLSTYVGLLHKRAKLKTFNGFSAEFFIKDPILDIGYIISEPLWILNSLNYSPYSFIKINEEHQNLINDGKFCGFIHKNNFYLMIYNLNNLFLYDSNYVNNNSNINKKSNYLKSIILNQENGENIINIQFLPNDLGKAYFIIVTDTYNSYLLNININNNNINYNFEKIKEKYSQSILAKSFSALWPFNSITSSQDNNKISNCFIISPHRQLKKKNNLYTYYNTLFLLSNDTLILKYISFSINNNSILPIIENTKDLSKEIIAHFSQLNKKFTSAKNEIYSVDSFFEENKKVLYIYSFFGFNNLDEKYILRIVIDNNFNITFDTLDISDKISKNNVKDFKNCKIFVNNYSDEGILVIPEDVIINFNYCNIDKNNNINGWKSCVNFKKQILGINKYNQYGIFNLDLFTSDQGIINFNPCLCYNSPNDKKGNYKIEQSDKTYIFLSNFLQGQLIQKNITNNKINDNINDNNSSMNNSFQSKSSRKIKTNLKPYEIILNNDKKKEFYIFLDEIIKKYLNKKSYINELNERDQYIISKFNSFFNGDNANDNDKNEILYDFINYINNLLNDEKTHIEIMEKQKKKLKLLTVQYLEEKYNKLMILYNIARKCTIEGIKFFEFYPDLLNEFFKLFEKIIIGINICKQENILYEKAEKNGNENNKLIDLFLDNFYGKLKEKKNDDNFNHLELFGKINNINGELLDIFFECFFYILNISLNNKNNLNNYLVQKDNLILFILNIILEINSNIEKLIVELNPEKGKNDFKKYNNGLWFLSPNNCISNKYLLQIFRYISSWKSESFKDSKINNDIIFLYAEQLHFLFKNYLLIGNNSLINKTDFINTQKIIDGILYIFDAERAYQICKKYLDDYTLAKIAFDNKNKYYIDLKNFMKKELIKKKGHIKYILQLILEFEIENINNSRDNNNIIFNYFEEFSCFENIISNIVKITKKAENFYNLYLLQKDILSNINDNKSVQNILLDIKKEAQINDDVENKTKIDYLIKILCIDNSLNFIKNSYLNEKNREIIEDNNNNRMIIDQEEEDFIHT